MSLDKRTPMLNTIKTLMIDGIPVDICTSYIENGKYDCYVYFAGLNTHYVPTTHASVELAEQHAHTFITEFMATGGLEAYKARIMAYYDDFRFTRF